MKHWTLMAGVCLVVTVGCAHKKVTAPVKAEMFPVAELTQQQKDELDVILKDSVLHFDFDSATLTPMSRGRLEYLAEALMVRPWASIRIAGHCDERGTVEYNLALGMRRAMVAKNYLVRLGVDEKVIDAVSFGAEVPAIDEASEEAYQANRRDEIVPQHVDLLGQL
jgi:peptidoglycan-associated lipoprotein